MGIGITVQTNRGVMMGDCNAQSGYLFEISQELRLSWLACFASWLLLVWKAGQLGNRWMLIRQAAQGSRVRGRKERNPTSGCATKSSFFSPAPVSRGCGNLLCGERAIKNEQ